MSQQQNLYKYTWGGVGLASGVLRGLIFGVQHPLENYNRRLACVPIMAPGVSKPLFLGAQRPHTEP